MKRIATILACCLALWGCSGAGTPTGWTFVQLTDNEFWDGHYGTDGHSVVWLSKEEYGRSPDVYLYDGKSIRALTADGQDNWNPKISEGYVVWQAMGHFQEVDGPVRKRKFLQFYDGQSIRGIPRSEGVITYNISGRHVAWNGSLDDGKTGIFLFDGDRTLLIAETRSANIYPDISGTSVVWINRNIYLHDEHGIRQLTTGGAHCQSPRIGGNNVIWLATRYGEEDEVFLYDGSVVLQLTDNEWRDGYPTIDPTHAAWKCFDGDDWEVFLFDGQTVTQITDNNYDDGIPSINGGNAVWSGNLTDDPNNRQVFLYDGRAVTQLTPTEARCGPPFISGSRIVFGHRDGNDGEVYVAIRKGAETADELRRAREGTGLYANSGGD